MNCRFSGTYDPSDPGDRTFTCYFCFSQVIFSAHTEEIAAYDYVEVPSGATFTLDATFPAPVPGLATGSCNCRAFNGLAPGPSAMTGVFLSFQTDPLEEAEVEFIRAQKKLIKSVLGGKLLEVSKTLDWAIGDYDAKTAPLLRSSSPYVSVGAVQDSGDKMRQLKGMCDQTLAAFEDYYGSVRLTS